MSDTNPSNLTRRAFLKGSLSVLGGVFAGKLLGKNQHYPFLSPTASKRIYIAPDDHTDYFWSAGEDTYRQAFLDTIDYYLDLADATSTNPSEYQSRWNCDGSYWMWVYEKNKTPTEFQRFVERIQSGHISVPLNALCVCLGGAPTEAVLRGMYYPGHIERKFDLRFKLAYLIENQTLPLGVVSLFAGSGARYSWKGICGCDSQIYTSRDREHDIYWWTGPDGSKLLLKWNSMLGDMPGLPGQYSQGMGGYAEARYPSAVVDYVDSDPDFVARYPYNVIGAFGHGWDDLQTQTDEFVTAAQSKTNAERQVIVSNELDFFLDFEAVYGHSIPSKSASFGNEWDLYCAALAEVSARVKRAVEKLRGVEALAAIVSLDNPNFMSSHEASRNQAWLNLGLFWEHNFGMVNPPSRLIQQRITWQKRLASEIESYVDNLALEAIESFGALLQTSGQAPRFYVFNPLSWQRSDYCEILWTGSDLIHVIDLSTNLEVPFQIETQNGTSFLRIFAENIPAVGYKVFEVRDGTGSIFTNAASVNGNLIENEFYKLTIADRGSIISLIDKQQGNREFVQPGEAMNDLGPSSGSLMVESAGAVTVTLLATASSPLNHTTRITLTRNSNRIQIQNDINQNFQDTFTWEYNFAIDNPDIWHEEVGAILRAKKVSQGGHYSDRVINTRYDWLTLNHFADISNSSAGMTLSNADCYFMRVGNSTVDNLDTSLAKISVLAGGRVVNGTNGLPNQGGDTHFMQRFALQTHGSYNPTTAMRFALEHQNPLVTGLVSGGSQYPGDTYSFLTLDNPNVLLWALKPHEDGMENGLVVRMWNLTANTQPFELRLASDPILSAHNLTHIETPVSTANVQNGALSESLTPHQIKTFAISRDTLPPAPSPTPTPPPPAVCTSQSVPSDTSPSVGSDPSPSVAPDSSPSVTSGASTSAVSGPSPSGTPDPSLNPKSNNTGCLFLPFIRR